MTLERGLAKKGPGDKDARRFPLTPA
jgi:hypothetical protein